jgi:predicted nucleotidyltransferase/uncharacterized protein (UPF0332 family)
MVKKKEEKRQNTLKIESEKNIAADFASKVYTRFDKLIKSIVLFGSTNKDSLQEGSDIDIIVIIDDVSIKWDLELISWYREELGKVVTANPYRRPIHITTIKLSTWWDDLLRGDPILVNVIRNGTPLIDVGSFFLPLQILLRDGKIKPTPEAIYTLLERVPNHLARANTSLLAAIDGLYWAMVDVSHAALIASKVTPASPEEIPNVLETIFVKNDLLKSKYVAYYRELHELAKSIVHGKTAKVPGKIVDEWINKTDEFIEVMSKLVDYLFEAEKEKNKN